MITAVHTLVYANDPDAARTFFRDVLQWPNVDAHNGWLIFGTGSSELGVHPLMGGTEHHEIALMCDDLDTTMAELARRGAQFADDPSDTGFGRAARLVVPGAGEMLLYEPSHPTAHQL